MKAMAHQNAVEMPSPVPPAVADAGTQRGQARPERITQKVAALPGTLVRHEMMASIEPVTDEFLVGIVDEIFLPLVVNDHYLRSQAIR